MSLIFIVCCLSLSCENLGVFVCADCPGTQSESAGKADSCEGCPNQQICATAPKGPDPGLLCLFLCVFAAAVVLFRLKFVDLFIDYWRFVGFCFFLWFLVIEYKRFIQLEEQPQVYAFMYLILVIMGICVGF